jgi:solute carrier family 25 protein 39/40
VPFSGFYWAGYEGIKRALTGGKGLGEGTGSLRGGEQDAKWRKWKEFGIAFVSGAGSGMVSWRNFDSPRVVAFANRVILLL